MAAVAEAGDKDVPERHGGPRMALQGAESGGGHSLQAAVVIRFSPNPPPRKNHQTFTKPLKHLHPQYVCK
ncbi:hypothetical protein RE428_35940 [Marinobacter nanhaiticus D15-8W]|nr:hypothetical protein RE428_35940 [Marinobacter nanhaiticus D15-8W]